MTPEDRLLREIDRIALRAMRKRRHQEVTPHFSVKKKIKFRSTLK